LGDGISRRRTRALAEGGEELVERARIEDIVLANPGAAGG